ncbi:uncharacterized protein si:ch211-106e7.2 [Puntigrus tetrazona]|uniref:uncharacterized protein si:ch211-106e7.2 n=1 Tax=Puntigrus tetrazona TaxID=1606681 RepID=UPI001C8AAAD4|nr:uncharacterized protein si:ch211-106e7.2 [Puntigrus tetrazona]
MQANSQRSARLQNSNGKGTMPGNGTSQNFYQLCLPPCTASPSYSEQTATENYFTRTVQPATSEQILELAQENQLNSNHMLPTGKQDSQIILWNRPSKCQLLLPVNNTNLQGAPTNNGQNMSHCAFNSTNSLYMQQQTTPSSVGPNNLQPFKTIDKQGRNEARIKANASNFHIRQHSNALTNLPIDLSKTRTSLPYDQNDCPPTETAHHGPSSLFGGYLYQLLFPEKSNNANVQMLSNCAQNLQMNNAAQKAIAIVSPLSPKGTAPANVLDKPATVKMNVSHVQETVHHHPNIPHPMLTNANLIKQTGQQNDVSSKHQQPLLEKSRLNDDHCSIDGAKSPVLANESTSQSPCASSPNLKCVVTEQNKSFPVQMQNEPSEKTNKNCTITDKKTVDPDTVPFIEWPLDRLKTLIAVFEQMENGHHKNMHKSDPGKEILKLYWNGDTSKFSEAVESGIYLSIMEEVYICSPMNEPVILRQIVNDARSKVIKDFHVLKHNEEPPNMVYKSSWLNLNENVDDIDKECGYSWFHGFQMVPEHEAQNSAFEAPSKLQEATKKPSLISRKQLPSEMENKVPAIKPTSNNKSLQENRPVSFNRQSPPMANSNCSPRINCQITNSQTTITNSVEAMVDLDEQGVLVGKSSLDNQFVAKIAVLPISARQSVCTNSPNPILVVAEQQKIVSLSQMQVGSSQNMLYNDCAVLDKNVRCETTPKPTREPPVHINELETDKTDALATKMTVLPHEMARPCFDNEVKGHLVVDAEKHEMALLNTPQVLEITDKVQQEKQISQCLQNNICNDVYEESPVSTNALPVTDNVSLTLNEQPNAVNPLKGMKNLVRTLERQNVLSKYKKLFEKHSGLKKHKQSFRINEESMPSYSQNGSMMNKCQEPSFQINASSSLKLDILTQEVAKHCFTANKYIATAKNATLRLDDTLCNQAKSPVLNDGSTRQSSYASPPKLYPVLTEPYQVQNESDEEMPEIDRVLSESVRCNLDPKPIEELSVNVNEEEFVEMDASASIKINVLPHEIAKQWFAGQFVQDEDTALLPVCKSKRVCSINSVLTDGLDSLVGNVSPPTLQPVLAETSQVQSDEEMPEIDCVVADMSMRDDTGPKPDQEFPVEMNEGEIGGLDTSVCIKMNVLPHVVAMQCFAEQMREDKDIAVPPEIMQKACLLFSPTDTVSTKEQTNMWRSEGTDADKCPLLTKVPTSKSTWASPPNLDPVIKESSQVQNEFSEEMPEIDCILINESMSCKTDPKPSQELPGNIGEKETADIDCLASIKINVLPPEIAELWFAGATEGKNSQKDATVHNFTEDQVKVQVLELKSESLLKDVKSEELKYPSSSGESLEFYCCLAKWFQSLEYGNGSLCMCQVKAEFKEKEIKIKAHSTSLEVQTEKDSPGDCERVEMDVALERTDNSEATDDSEYENPLLHDPMNKTQIVKDMTKSEEVCKTETKISEQKRNDCATNMTLMNKIKQDTPAPDLKDINMVCLALFGSHSEKGSQLKLTKRCKETSSCEEPPKTLQVTISSHLKVKNKSESKKRKSVESEVEDAADERKRIQRASLQNLIQRKSLPSLPVSGLCKNGLFSTSVRQPLSQSGNVNGDIRLAEGNKRKRRYKQTTQQMSMNKCIIRAKTVPSKMLPLLEDGKKSKYELRNPALMPLDKGPALEFKVLPETFNFEDGAELEADTSQSIQNEMSDQKEKTERMKTGNVPTQGVWSFSTLKKKCSLPIQDTHVSGACSLFQEFKKKYQEKKDIASKQNLNPSERT